MVFCKIAQRNSKPLVLFNAHLDRHLRIAFKSMGVLPVLRKSPLKLFYQMS
jgi:hypothetical protein